MTTSQQIVDLLCEAAGYCAGRNRKPRAHRVNKHTYLMSWRDSQWHRRSALFDVRELERLSDDQELYLALLRGYCNAEDLALEHFQPVGA